MEIGYMVTQIYTFKITYADCDNRIWRTAAVSSNYTLAQLGYLVLATFDTMACHLFEMKYQDTTYFLDEDALDELDCEAAGGFDLLTFTKIGRLGMHTGDVLEMTYDLGCCQVFELTLLEISDMPKGGGRAYPKILDGAGRGIVDDMPADELAEVIRKIDLEGHSGIYYSSDDYDDVPEWDYRKYGVDWDNLLLKRKIDRIRDGYEDYEDE